MTLSAVMAGLVVPAIHVFLRCEAVKTWMPATSVDKRGHDVIGAR
jgi:hypothetical protein